MYRNALKGAAIGAAGALTYAAVSSQTFAALKNRPFASLVSRAYCSSVDADGLVQAHKKKLVSILSGESAHKEKEGKIVTSIPTANGLDQDIASPLKRELQLKRLATEEFDLLVIGGGVVGTATAVEAASRGLKVAMVDKSDFASGTSSKSTKLIHGGVRYLEQAFTQLDISMIHLVKEALRERTHMIDSCAYMNKPLPILIPISTWWEIPYMWIGVKMYEFFAGKTNNVPKAYFLSRNDTIAKFPELDANKLHLKGSIVYFDGQMNDARHTVALALTAADQGAAVANYVKVEDILHDATTHKVSGAVVTDTFTGDKIAIKARAVVNAAGPFADQIRKMDDPSAPELIIPAAGSHLSLPAGICPDDMGMLIPKTPDGRLLFFLPWEKGIIAGTTDSKSDVVDIPVPDAKDVDFIIGVMNQYLKKPLSHSDVKSVWAGLRPLVRDPSVEGTAKLSRNHVVLTSDNGLVSVMGGKYTTHRQMAEDTIDAVLKAVPREAFSVSDESKLTHSITYRMPIHGAADMSAITGGTDYDVIRTILKDAYLLDDKHADYLTRNYGTRALIISSLAAEKAFSELGKKKVHITDVNAFVAPAEIDYAVEYEMAQRVEDVVVRRTRLGFLDSKSAYAMADTVVKEMGDKLGWSKGKREIEKERAVFVIDHMDFDALKQHQKKQ